MLIASTGVLGGLRWPKGGAKPPERAIPGGGAVAPETIKGGRVGTTTATEGGAHGSELGAGRKLREQIKGGSATVNTTPEASTVRGWGR
ncbi:hypothetical protein GCM10009556_104160 [Acrocarpospora pleiomorpha]